MKTLYINLRSIEDVKEFVNTITKIDGDALLSEGRFIVDAKSIMGIFSLNLTNRLKLDIEEWKEEYVPLFEQYLAADE